jgi:Ca2+-binding RTX toxin-like protein
MPTPILGTASPDLLTGTPDTDVLFAGSGSDTVLGLEGNDTVYGNREEDWIFGNIGNDLVHGGQGKDTLCGGDHDDFLSGDLDSDILVGDRGDDTLSGGEGQDSLFGNEGNDLIFGNSEEDILYGGKGNDTLYGGKGNDWISGNLGNDYLAGDLGLDTLEGGAGTDRFVVGTAQGFGSSATTVNFDVILDFRHNEDLIQLTNGLSFNDLTFVAGTGENTGNTILQNRGTGENLAIFIGILPEALDRSDFLNDPSLPPTPSTPSNPPEDSEEIADSPELPSTPNKPPTKPNNPPVTPSPPTSGSGDGSTDPGDGSTDPGDGSTDPGDDSTDPGDDSTDPGDDSTDPGDDSTDPNQPPVFTSTANTQATQDAPYIYNIVANDPDAGDTLTITPVNLPDWLTFTDNGNGTATLTGTPGVADIDTPEIVLKVRDSQNAEVEQRFVLTVVGQNSAFSYADASRGVIANLDSGVGFTPKYDAFKGSPLKIMPLGDSITQGKINNTIPDAEQEGYRRYLWEKLTDLGLEIDFVGSQSNGTNLLPDRDHEGHPGENITFIRNGINGWIAAITPDVILLKAGTNNTNNDTVDDGQGITNNLDLLIKRINQNASFTGELLVSSIPPIRTTLVSAQHRNRHIDADSYNNKIQGVVNQNLADGNVTFVDMRSGLTQDDITPQPDDSGLHPTDGGYQKISQFWYEAVIENIRADNDTDEDLQNIDNVTGSAFGDILIGNANANFLNGGDGDDKLTGGGGADNLTGGNGADAFVYKNPNEGRDIITDFGNGGDIFQISASGFGGGFVAGTLLQTTAVATGVFVGGSNPGYLGQMAHVLYDTATGLLSFDADGNGGGAKVELAQLLGMPTLNANQFSIVV